MFTTYKEEAGLGNSDEMIAIKSWKDTLPDEGEESPAPNFFHTQYQQYYNGVPVEGAEYTEHYSSEEEECVFAVSGFLLEGLELSVDPSFDEATALELAIDHIGAETYEWDSTNEYPTGNLVIVYTGSDSTSNDPGDYKLAYKFTVVALSEIYNADIYIDAQNGDILKEVTNIHADGEFPHIYYGQKYDLDTRYENRLIYQDRWFLFADDNTRNIYTDDYDYPGNAYSSANWTWSLMPYSLGDDVWGDDDNPKATSAHYCAQKAWDYYLNIHNRLGMTGGSYGNHIRVRADNPRPTTSSNGAWGASYVRSGNNDYILIGYNESNDTYCSTYDILGHEFTHGVIYNSRQLPYEKVSGAINESFADIFGFLVERYVYGTVNNWTIGEDASTLRDLSNPHYANQPSYYKEPVYYFDPIGCSPTNANDQCKVHTNSGVQNRWFYFLSMGGSQTVNGLTRTAIGIGIYKAARIAYYTMVNYKNYDPSNANFNTVRANSLLAAATLYGTYSPEYYNVCRAWWAVNVGSLCYEPFNRNVASCSWKPNSRFETSFAGISQMNPANVYMNISPNPANMSIMINLEEPNAPFNGEYIINIIDVTGKIVFNEHYTNLISRRVDISDFNDGIYFVNIVSNNWVRSSRFIKKQ